MYTIPFFELSRDLMSDKDKIIEVTEQYLEGPNGQQVNNIPDSLALFYSEISHLNFEWETREAVDNGSKIVGRINILPADKVTGSWEGVVYFDGIDHYSFMEKFKIVDFFFSESCAGFMQNDNVVDYMHYLDLGKQDTQPMDLTFEGYYQLMMMARGFQYWQLIVLNLKNGKGNEHEVEKFKTYMPQLFPDFKWEEFVALYEKVRIK